MDQKKDAMKKAKAKEWYLAWLFFSRAVKVRYKQLKHDPKNEHLKEKDTYPKDYDSALKLLNNYRSSGGRVIIQLQKNEGAPGLAFLWKGQETS